MIIEENSSQSQDYREELKTPEITDAKYEIIKRLKEQRQKSDKRLKGDEL